MCWAEWVAVHAIVGSATRVPKARRLQRPACTEKEQPRTPAHIRLLQVRERDLVRRAIRLLDTSSSLIFVKPQTH